MYLSSLAKMIEMGEPIYENGLLFSLVLLMTIGATYTDVKDGKIYDKFNLALILLRFALVFYYPLTRWTWTGSLFAMMVVWIPAIVYNRKAGGDIKFAFTAGLYLGEATGAFMLASTAVGLIIALYAYYRANRFSFPYATAFFGGHCLMGLLVYTGALNMILLNCRI